MLLPVEQAGQSSSGRDIGGEQSMPIAKWRYRKIENGGFQKWTGYPDSPVLISDFPTQTICLDSYGRINLYVLTPTFVQHRWYSTLTSKYYLSAGERTGRTYRYTGGNWVRVGSEDIQANTTPDAYQILESNNTIYVGTQNNPWDHTGTTVYLSKTTTPSQDAGIQANLIRLK